MFFFVVPWILETDEASEMSEGILAILSLTFSSLDAAFSNSCRALISSSGSGGSAAGNLGDRVTCTSLLPSSSNWTTSLLSDFFRSRLLASLSTGSLGSFSLTSLKGSCLEILAGGSPPFSDLLFSVDSVFFFF